MPCGCSQNCGCEVIAGTNNVTVVRIGDTFTISVSDASLVQSVADTDCIGLAVGGGTLTATLNIAPINTPISLACTGAGLVGDLVIDPTSTAPISAGPAGLKIDCCDGAGALVGVDSTNTVTMINSLGIVTATVIPNTDAGLENQVNGVSIKLQDDPAAIAPTCENRLRFNTSGDLTFLTDGATVENIPAGALVRLAGTESNNGDISSSVSFTNNDTCTVIALFQGIGRIVAPSTGTSASTRRISQQMQLNAASLSGGAVSISGSGLAAFSDYNFQPSGGSATPITTDLAIRWQANLMKWVRLPPGASVTMEATTQCLEDQVGWQNEVANGASFQIANYSLAVFPQRVGGWLVS